MILKGGSRQHITAFITDSCYVLSTVPWSKDMMLNKTISLSSELFRGAELKNKQTNKCFLKRK